MNIVLALSGVVVKELYRRKDFYVLFIMTAVITLVMGSINFFGDAKIARYLKEICLLLIWISALVIAIVTTARQIPAERENRTIFPLLAKPVSRAQVVAGKFAGCWLASGVALLVFYLLVRPKRPPERASIPNVSIVSLGLVLLGYFAIYLITPRDLYWHLRFSLNRLFLQLWPSAIFLFFLFVRPQNRLFHRD